MGGQNHASSTIQNQNPNFCGAGQQFKCRFWSKVAKPNNTFKATKASHVSPQSDLPLRFWVRMPNFQRVTSPINNHVPILRLFWNNGWLRKQKTKTLARIASDLPRFTMESPIKLMFGLFGCCCQDPRHFDLLTPKMAIRNRNGKVPWGKQIWVPEVTHHYDFEPDCQVGWLQIDQQPQFWIMNQTAKVRWSHDDQQPHFWIRMPKWVGPTMIKTPMLVSWSPAWSRFWVDGWPALRLFGQAEAYQIHSSELDTHSL